MDFSTFPAKLVVVLLLVPPVPVLLLIGFVRVFQILVLSVGFRFPLVVLDDLAIDRMVVPIIRIVVPRMDFATCDKRRRRNCRREQAYVDLPQEHGLSFRSGIGRSQLTWMFIGDGLVGLAGQSIARAVCTGTEAPD